MGGILARFNNGELIALITIVGGVFVGLIAVLMEGWVKLRRAELNGAPKRDLIARGLSGDDIRTVLDASSKESRMASDFGQPDSAMTDGAARVRGVNDQLSEQEVGGAFER